MTFTFDLAVGAALIAFAIYTLLARKLAPSHLTKLEPMKRRWGRKQGQIIHLISYTIIPFVGGSLLLFNDLT